MSVSMFKDEFGKLVTNASTYMQGIDAFAVRVSAASVYFPINSVNQYLNALHAPVNILMTNIRL